MAKNRKSPRPVAIRLQEAVMFDIFPDSPAVIADFFISGQEHYEALYYPIRAGEITVEDLDRVLGDPEAITEMVNAAPSNPHRGIVFGEGLGLGSPMGKNRWERCGNSRFYQVTELENPEYPYDLGFVDPVMPMTVGCSGVVIKDAVDIGYIRLEMPIEELVAGPDLVPFPAKMEPSLEKAMKEWVEALVEMKTAGMPDDEILDVFNELPYLKRDLILDGLVDWLHPALMELPLEIKNAVVVHRSHPGVANLEKSEYEWIVTEPTIVTDDPLLWEGVVRGLSKIGVSGCRLPL